MKFTPENALTVRLPEGQDLPLVCDSPHSGVEYPDDFASSLPLWQLRAGEDTHVDALWRDAPAHGATLIAARFPRSYIDPNRELGDLDPELLGGPWPEPLAPGEKTRLGYGLIWRQIGKGLPIYARKLAVDEVQARIEHCWKPYHAALGAAVEGAHARFGAVWHLNLHSMPNNAFERLGLTRSDQLADFVLGDRDGTTCEPALLDVIEACLRGHGYSVARNDPYKGVALIGRIGRPAERRHSLQIEIRRPIYMDEVTREPNAGFEPLRTCLNETLAAVAAHVRRSL
ncbi:N-formylglutamate amidohydrolase [Roseateles sp. DAIF2]|uniref:N-formylglutamate amidohydrolase n=1 Tax=Roseateles sp. DAIF2 TaxID=2714952 RepID=UPI0018A24F3F|nr:N-formylglutamate amidohydrolase [Roseateles sp. DAIF2]QPF75524.1 N-formylglutamate amidohydrolase [Roseateles sp. DAIF2]